MAGIGVVPGHLTHREVCGLYYSRDRIRRDRRREMAKAIGEAFGERS